MEPMEVSSMIVKTKSLTWVGSAWVLKLGLRSFVKRIWQTRRSIFLDTRNKAKLAFFVLRNHPSMSLKACEHRSRFRFPAHSKFLKK